MPIAHRGPDPPHVSGKLARIQSEEIEIAVALDIAARSPGRASRRYRNSPVPVGVLLPVQVRRRESGRHIPHRDSGSGGEDPSAAAASSSPPLLLNSFEDLPANSWRRRSSSCARHRGAPPPSSENRSAGSFGKGPVTLPDRAQGAWGQASSCLGDGTPFVIQNASSGF